MTKHEFVQSNECEERRHEKRQILRRRRIHWRCHSRKSQRRNLEPSRALPYTVQRVRSYHRHPRWLTAKSRLTRGHRVRSLSKSALASRNIRPTQLPRLRRLPSASPRGWFALRLRRRSNRSEAGGMIKCKTCCDVPTRRPLERPCACGEHYQQETIAFHADGHRGTASAHGVSFHEKGQQNEQRI